MGRSRIWGLSTQTGSEIYLQGEHKRENELVALDFYWSICQKHFTHQSDEYLDKKFSQAWSEGNMHHHTQPDGNNSYLAMQTTQSQTHLLRILLKDMLLFKAINHQSFTNRKDEFQAHDFFNFQCILKWKSVTGEKTRLRQKGSGWLQQLWKVFPHVGTSEAEATSMPALGTQHRPWRTKPK